MTLMEEIEKYLNGYGIESLYVSSDFVVFEDDDEKVIANVQETDDFEDVADVTRKDFENALFEYVDNFGAVDGQHFRFDQILLRPVDDSNAVIRHETGLYDTGVG